MNCWIKYIYQDLGLAPAKSTPIAMSSATLITTFYIGYSTIWIACPSSPHCITLCTLAWSPALGDLSLILDYSKVTRLLFCTYPWEWGLFLIQQFVIQDTATQGNTTEDLSLQQTQPAHAVNLHRHENTLSNHALPMKNTALPYAECHKCCTSLTSLAPRMV